MNKDQYERLRNALLSDTSINEYNRNLFKTFFEWEEEKLKRTNNLSQLDESSYKTLKDYPNRFRNVNEWFKNKSWNTLSVDEIKKVYNDLEDGIIVNHLGKPFGDKRSYYNKIFKSKPFKLAGLRDKVDTALEFFTDKRRKEVQFISEESFKKMVSCCANPNHLVLLWLSWDVGENINSLLELKKKNFKRQINKDTNEPEYLIYLPFYILKRSRQMRTEPTLFVETANLLDIVLSGLNPEDKIFSFGYRQALKIFNSVARKSKTKCEPTGKKPSWKDLRSGMACNLFVKGWSVEDLNLRLGHSPTSQWFNSYVNYLAVNKQRAKKEHNINSFNDLKEQFEEAKQREKAKSKDIDMLKTELDKQKLISEKAITYLELLMRKYPTLTIVKGGVC